MAARGCRANVAAAVAANFKTGISVCSLLLLSAKLRGSKEASALMTLVDTWRGVGANAFADERRVAVRIVDTAFIFDDVDDD